MPDYDEYGIAYKNRRAASWANLRNESMYSHWLVVDGKLAGTWAQMKKGGKTEIETKLLVKLNKRQQQAVKGAVKKYLNFTATK
jgi:hypothetical protein